MMKKITAFLGFPAKKYGKTFCVFLLCVFLLMVLCNALTGFFVDDFNYMNSFYANAERIDSFFEIFPSLYVHAKLMNGRTIAHFFVQLFLLLPPPVFDIFNSAAFVLLLIVICRIGAAGKKNHPLTLPAVFAAVWIFTPEFGQVALWTDGSCNYLWGVVFSLLFICPFARKFLTGKDVETVAGKILFVICGFIAGGYLENTSSAAIFISVMLMLCSVILKKSKPKLTEYMALASSAAGFLFMMLAPAELANKAGSLSPGDVRRGFIAALEMLKELRAVLLTLAVLFAVALCVKVAREKLVLSAVFTVGALFANFVMSLASYYPGRASFPVLTFLIVACAILTDEIFRADGGVRIAMTSVTACLFVVCAYYLLTGVNDVYSTFLLQKNNEMIIEEAKASGETDVALPIIYPQTKYSAPHGLKYLDAENSGTWPNAAMAAYYKVHTIIGIP